MLAAEGRLICGCKPSLLGGAEEPVPGVAAARHDQELVVEALVDGPDVNVNCTFRTSANGQNRAGRRGLQCSLPVHMCPWVSSLPVQMCPWASAELSPGANVPLTRASHAESRMVVSLMEVHSQAKGCGACTIRVCLRQRLNPLR